MMGFWDEIEGITNSIGSYADPIMKMLWRYKWHIVIFTVVGVYLLVAR